MARPRAVVLLSGGLDSAVTAARAGADGCDVHALTVSYGQRHAHELRCAERVARALGASEHRFLSIDLAQFGGSSLFAGQGSIPRGEDPLSRGGVPSTYVPARNTVFLALALGWAETLDAQAIYLGVNALDYSGYPDCRPEYLEAFARMAALATRRGIEGHPFEIRAPLLRLSKAEIVRLGTQLGVDFGNTSSCYDPSPEGAPCGACDSCLLRAKGFAEAGLADPILAPRGGTA